MSQGSGFEGGFFPINQPQRSGLDSANKVAGTNTAASASTADQPMKNAQIDSAHSASANINNLPSTVRRWPN